MIKQFISTAFVHSWIDVTSRLKLSLPIKQKTIDLPTNYFSFLELFFKYVRRSYQLGLALITYLISNDNVTSTLPKQCCSISNKSYFYTTITKAYIRN